MKKVTVFLVALLLVLLSGTAYSLTNFWYNGYALDGSGEILPSASVNVRVSIYSGTTLAYQETHAGVTTDQFGGYAVKVGTGVVVSGALGPITTTANTRIMLETNNGPGWVLSAIASISSVMFNTTVMPGNINLPQHKIIIGDALGDGEALFVGGDMTATNDGSTANFQIAPGAIVNADINNTAGIAVTKLAAGGANQFLVNNGTNAWASLNINSTLQGNGVGTALGLNLANANTWTGRQIFTAANPQTPLAPAVGNDLTNKTYVDGSIATVSSYPFVTVGNVAGLTAERAIATNATLTGTDGGANSSYTLGINLGNANTWTALQTFNAQGVDINAGYIDNTTIGGTTPSTGAFASAGATAALSVNNTSTGSAISVTNDGGDVKLSYNTGNVAANAITIPNDVSVYYIISDNNGTTDVVTLPGGTPGEILYVVFSAGTNGDDVTIGSTIVLAANQTLGVTLVYVGTSWVITGTYLQ